MAEQTPDNRLIKVVSMLKKLGERAFYGKVLISIEAGKPVNVKVEESFKVD